jgi:GT2 family glycosyltransferase/glycosyltransferase involved in cell wall biosynthesis
MGRQRKEKGAKPGQDALNRNGQEAKPPAKHLQAPARGRRRSGPAALHQDCHDEPQKYEPQNDESQVAPAIVKAERAESPSRVPGPTDPSYGDELARLQRELEEQSTWAQKTARALVERDETIRYLQRQVEEQSAWARRSTEVVDERDRTIRRLQAELAEQSAWARRIADELAASAAMVHGLQAHAAKQSLELGKVRAQIDLMARRGDELAAMLFAARDQLPSPPAGHSDGCPKYETKMLPFSTGANGHAGNSTGPAGRSHDATNGTSYQSLVLRIRETARKLLPANATVLVVSKGDEELLDLPVRAAWHFPRDSAGGYPGYYPADSGAAINHLEQLRDLGAQYLLLPGTATWWLDHYDGLRRHLEQHYHRMSDSEHCRLYDLSVKAQPSENASFVVPQSSTYDVICLPVIDWHFRFQRPQQLITQFAQGGHRCYYFQTKFGAPGEPLAGEEIAPNVYNPRLPGPVSTNLYQGEIDDEALEEMLAGLEALRGQDGIADAICLVQLPFWAPLALAAHKRWGWKIIYDCMDEHSGFSTNHSSMLRYEDSLILEADLAIATSRLLYDKMSPRARRALLLPNATDFNHFSSPGTARPLAHLPRPIIGYYGAISDWFDVGMVRSAAAERPDWQFVLIGHTFGAEISWLQQLSNVHFLGEKPYQALPSYLRDFDVACIPFLLNALTAATNPVKFYEYLSAGKPVVAVNLPDLAPYQDHYYPVRDPSEFVRQIELALVADSPAKARERIDLARRNTWGDRYRLLDAAIAELYGKVAVVIVSYNNLQYLKLCLKSIWKKTNYPNFQVVVVDNGSESAVVEFLEACAAKESRLKVILNRENLGFARANNLGIAAAGDCEYVVLLNDDTIVTRGWLDTMVRYLNDPRIGLVGPVTNWAGNEARVDVPYEDVGDMDRFAEKYTSEHAGRFFDIPMLAMFCLGARRQLIDRLGPLDERFGVGLFEDDDYSLRVRQLWYRVVCAQDIFIHHWGRASFRRMDAHHYNRLFSENRRKFEEKWGEPWQPHKCRNG